MVYQETNVVLICDESSHRLNTLLFGY